MFLGSTFLPCRDHKPCFFLVPPFLSDGKECHKGKADPGDRSEGLCESGALSSTCLVAFHYRGIPRLLLTPPRPLPRAPGWLHTPSCPAPPTQNKLGSLWMSRVNLTVPPGANEQAQLGAGQPGHDCCWLAGNSWVTGSVSTSPTTAKCAQRVTGSGSSPC